MDKLKKNIDDRINNIASDDNDDDIDIEMNVNVSSISSECVMQIHSTYPSNIEQSIHELHSHDSLLKSRRIKKITNDKISNKVTEKLEKIVQVNGDSDSQIPSATSLPLAPKNTINNNNENQAFAWSSGILL